MDSSPFPHLQLSETVYTKKNCIGGRSFGKVNKGCLEFIFCSSGMTGGGGSLPRSVYKLWQAVFRLECTDSLASPGPRLDLPSMADGVYRVYSSVSFFLSC
ncbi:hypothetical protein FQN55_003039 [Onygenales sp. PD_40]|nr:hypothetical protein FQN55_003039 [Onygenales sp. PD_40]